MSSYWEFIHEAQAVFGFDLAEAREYYREFKEVFTAGEPATVEDLHEWGDLAVDLAYPEDEGETDDSIQDEDFEDDFEDDYDEPLTDRERRGQYEDYDDDPYVDAGEWLEVTADLTYMEG